MNQPNLQTIMDNITVELHFQAGKVTQEYIGTKTAIDAVYAGIKRDVLGEQITDNQAIALKRWCYGEQDVQSSDTEDI